MADKIQLPQSGGGILRYSEGSTSRFQIGPVTVLIMIVVVIIIAALLHTLG